ncbi:MAG: carboxypeptidase regulatory-like domain-containing protein [Pyrinomonadaceae bacterium]|nr:carboxypeptidase regulatory-like domain-containing protein [Pyrinomonadaceae bacterium]
MICNSSVPWYGRRWRMRRSHALIFGIVVFFSLAPLHYGRAQQPPNSARAKRPATQIRRTEAASQNKAAQTSSEPRITGSITGRVTTDDGQPLQNATVYINSVNASQRGFRSTSTDGEGKFRFADLESGVYHINASVRGYTSFPNIATASSAPRHYRLGEDVAITLTKGGAITGMVTDAQGEPMISVAVRAVPVRDARGHRTVPQGFGGGHTDDRGIYRLWGVAPGSYTVVVGGSPFGGSGDDAPTYYPSAATSGTAGEVVVPSRGEASGIDIRYRNEQGHTVSGTFTGVIKSSTSLFLAVNVLLRDAASGMIEASTGAFEREGSYPFALSGVPDGEYEIVAQHWSREIEGNNLASPPQRVTVRGADVGGIQLKLGLRASISGRIVLEALQEANKTAACKSEKGRALIEEVVVTARRDIKAGGENQQPLNRSASMSTAPGKQGDFKIQNIDAGRYRLEIGLPSEHLYVRSITASMAASIKQPKGAGRGGDNNFTVRWSEQVGGLTVAVAEGAAELRGRVMAADEGQPLPSPIRVHLVPREPERADASLRFAEVVAENDGSFTFRHIAPGRYWLLTRAAPVGEAIEEAAMQPAAWDMEERGKLRREAAAANTEVDLQPCQRVADHVLRYAPPSASKATN